MSTIAAKLGRASPAAVRREAHGHALRRDPRAFPRLLRRARPPANPLGIAGAGRPRPVGAADHGGQAPAQALLPRPGEAAAPPADLLPEVLPDAGHRPS